MAAYSSICFRESRFRAGANCMGKEVPMKNGVEIRRNKASSGSDLWPRLNGYAHVKCDLHRPYLASSGHSRTGWLLEDFSDVLSLIIPPLLLQYSEPLAPEHEATYTLCYTYKFVRPGSLRRSSAAYFKAKPSCCTATRTRSVSFRSSWTSSRVIAVFLKHCPCSKLKPVIHP